MGKLLQYQKLQIVGMLTFTSFSPVTYPNIGNKLQNILIFSFSHFDALV